MRPNHLSFFDVRAFAAGYWREQRWRLAVILSMFVSAAMLETYLPTALSNLLATIRLGQGKTAILLALAVFLGVYFVQMVLFGVSFIFYSVFETTIFKSLLDDAFAHVQRLSEHFFVNTFTGAIVSKISRALRFPMLAGLMIGYVGLLFLVRAFFVFRISGPAQGEYAAAQDSFIAYLADSIGGVATTKTYAQETVENANFFDLTEQLRVRNLRAYRLADLSAIVQRLLLTGMLVLLLDGGVWYLLHDRATVESMAYLAFAYPGNLLPVFDGLSVDIRAGERVALVGHSGSGKMKRPVRWIRKASGPLVARQDGIYAGFFKLQSGGYIVE